MQRAIHSVSVGLALALCAITPAQAKVKEVVVTPSKITQQVGERALAKQMGSCSPKEIIGSLPRGEEWEADLHKSALIGFHEEGASINTSFWSWGCQQPRWDVLQFRVGLSFPLSALPPGNKPFLAFLRFAPLSATSAQQKHPQLPGVSAPEPSASTSKASQRLLGVTLDNNQGLLCMKKGGAANHALQHRYLAQNDITGFTNQCGNGQLSPLQGPSASVLLHSAGHYWVNVTPLLMQARQNQQSSARLIIQGQPGPSANGNWPSQSSSQLMALDGWKLTIVADECNWNTFPGQCGK